MSLNDEDRQELKQKRGLTDEIIDRAHLLSGTKANVKAGIESLEREVGSEPLVEAKLLWPNRSGRGGKYYPNPAFTEGRILIPYFNASGKVVKLRPHKHNLPGTPSLVYCERWATEGSGPLVITEGEFKALALQVLGFRAVAVPGISTHIDKNWSELLDLVKDNGITEVVIGFDRENKSETTTHWTKRYDASLYAYRLANKFFPEQIKARIATIPEEWMEPGRNHRDEPVLKADWDSILAKGIDRDEIRAVIENALEPREYLSSCDGEERYVIARRTNAAKYFGPIQWSSSGFEIKKGSGDEEYFERVCNFTMREKAHLHRGEDFEIERLMELKAANMPPVTVRIPKSVYAHAQQFRTWVASRGPYVFEGTQGTLDKIRTYIETKSVPRLIFEPPYVGLVEDKRIPGAASVWIGENVAIDMETGKVRSIGEDGTVGEGYTAFQPPENIKAPYIETETTLDLQHVLRLFIEHLSYQGYLWFGWVLATIIATPIYKQNRSFPLLFISGQRSSGKTTVANWAERFFGIEEHSETSNSTPKALARVFASRSDLPVHFDEYRNGGRLDEFFRLVYDRSGYTRAAFSNDNEVNKTAIRATGVITGEEFPNDSALISRCVTLYLAERNEEDPDYYDEIEYLAQSGELSNAFYQLVQTAPEVKKDLRAALKQAENDLKAAGVKNARTVKNYGAILAALRGFKMILPGDEQDCFDAIAEAAKMAMVDMVSSGMLQEWLDAVTNLMNEPDRGAGGEFKMIDGRHIKFDYNRNKVSVALHKTCDVVAIRRRQAGLSTFNTKTIKNYLMEAESAFWKRTTFRGQNLYCVEMDIHDWRKLGGGEPPVFEFGAEGTSSTSASPVKGQRPDPEPEEDQYSAF